MSSRKLMKTGEVGFCKTCGDLVNVAVPPEDRLERRIVRAVERRGYRGRWTAAQFLARQMAKAAEELSELAGAIDWMLPPELGQAIEAAGDLGKLSFDHGYWADSSVMEDTVRQALKELSDLQVVLVCAKAAVEELVGEDIDLMRLAAEKAEGDVKRGVR